jgi:hypothetical protein
VSKTDTGIQDIPRSQKEVLEYIARLTQRRLGLC